MTYNKLSDECVICLDILSSSKLIYLRCCNNLIHDECLQNWLNKDNRCPLCNHNIHIKYSCLEYFLYYICKNL